MVIMLSRLEINKIGSRTDNPIGYSVATIFDLFSTVVRGLRIFGAVAA